MAHQLLFGAADTQQNEGCFPQLSFQERLLCFAGCWVVGLLVQFMSFGSFAQIALGNPTPFALSITIGNILSLMGTGFLVGFKRQFTNMSDPNRLYTSIVYVGAIIMTLFSAFVLHSGILCLLSVLVQIGAYFWYCASYIPYARTCILNCFKNTVGSRQERIFIPFLFYRFLYKQRIVSTRRSPTSLTRELPLTFSFIIILCSSLKSDLVFLMPVTKNDEQKRDERDSFTD
eukprot:TRINITY_DN4543_c0_g3_i2.p1 TRINITY_DN4543_c0_g3~~TRINITY_DN4543_c0_g3_i2.p1  ORF type:complete len:231 (+),score=13.69 TRINITY_DN4543_c0_g3_i2:99-791(+)